jgi:sialic acid synthase SpsE
MMRRIVSSGRILPSNLTTDTACGWRSLRTSRKVSLARSWTRSTLRPPEVEPVQAPVNMRRSIVSKVSIMAGTVITEEMLCYKRPGSGIPPAKICDVVGFVAAQDIPEDTLVLYEWLGREKR